ncbi:alpha/beta hydrolase [Streptomyces phaeochromogenes]|uniref:Alpha/beta hydrolase n=1 Tax=Streptomyces phaeochromogenes TaxID=1923 RepID=A0ABZ1HHI8_STRPH|nr:alpha/beta hydrolase [Streptomyces phaeochromogenes]WSD17529.1 alpha/beta hydrolase [Streptomyces phaeochromogenes]
MDTHTGNATTPDGTRLAYRDHHAPEPDAELAPGAQRPPLLLLHGLAGHMGEWDDLLPLLLADGRRVITYDARGHGVSTRRPPDMTRASAVRDVTILIEELSLPTPVALLGQSLGGHTAFLAAAAHPHLVDSLILVEAGPAGPSPDLPAEIAAWLDSWPTPFASLSSAAAFLGHEAWARGLEEREDGHHPRWDRDTMLAAVAELSTHAYWPEWDQVACPTLVVRGAKGTMREAEMTRMARRAQLRTGRPPQPRTLTEVIEDAGHDVHLDQPRRLHAAVRTFLAERNAT